MNDLNINKIKSIKINKYQDIGMNDLVCYAIFKNADEKNLISRENLVMSCFKLFPQKFSIRGYDNFPDSNVIDKRWVDLRDRGYLAGKTSTGIRLTTKGIIKAKVTMKKMKISKKENEVRKIRENRTQAGRHIQRITLSDAYKKFAMNKSAENINANEFRELLLCTMETPSTIMFKALNELKNAVSIYKRNDLINFLENLEEKHANLLHAKSSSGSKYTGGMIKRLNN